MPNDWKQFDTSRLQRAYARIDRAWQKAVEGYEKSEQLKIVCKEGCSACCTAGKDSTAWGDSKLSLAFSPSGAALLWQTLLSLPIKERSKILERSRKIRIRDDLSMYQNLGATAEYSMCPLLGDSGRCVAYNARPIFCRNFGLPVQYRLYRTDFTGSLACPKNQGHLYLSELSSPVWVRDWLEAISDLDKVEEQESRRGGLIGLDKILEALSVI